MSITASNVAQAQSASTGISDAEYLAALSTMSADMDLNGLAGQTFEPVAVVAPQLPVLASDTDTVSCESLNANGNISKFQLGVLGQDSVLSAREIASLPTCFEQSSGLVVGYLLPNS